MTIINKYLERSCYSYPEKIAIDMEVQLTYKLLYDLVCKFSTGLNLLGIEERSKVAIWIPKKLEMYISILGTLQHSSIYIPIDISTPASRVSYILRDSGSEVLICRAIDYEQLIESQFQLQSLKQVILVDDKKNEIFPVNCKSWAELLILGNVQTTINSASSSEEDLAYILYTSGSTGVPKGVAISHRAASSFIDWSSLIVELDSNDRVSNHASPSFDLSVFDIFSTISSGATLVPLPSWPMGTGYPFAKFIEKYGISIWYSVPTLLRRITESQLKKVFDLSSLRTVIFAGEPFHKVDLIKFHETLPNAKLYNWYGPTETNVCTYYKVMPSELDTMQSVPIGTPCPYVKVKIVYDFDNTIGELYIGGKSLMSGYWRNNTVDTSSFTNKLGEEVIYYPTGDLVTVKKNLLYYHGRRDSQIKRHGYRIELGEIEHNILQCSYISEATVALFKNSIVAFTVPNKNCSLVKIDMLNKYIAKSLPPYMRPDKIILIDSLPRNNRGKIDKITLERVLDNH